jgi:hypothetical protein
MIVSADFLRFRGFHNMHIELVPHAYIVGPNSAGKSTVVEAVALAEDCLRTARRKVPTLDLVQGTRFRSGYPMPAGLEDEEDPVRYEFGRLETRVTMQWASGGRIHMVWPEDSGEGPRSYFYLEDGGTLVRNPSEVRKLFTPVTIVPVITPLDRIEELKDSSYVEKCSGTRLASRHFRNHAWQMHKEGRWALFKEFCRTWLPEIELLDVSLDLMANRLAVFYSETGSRVPKELAWAGDGFQIWVQLLWHVFEAKDARTIVLDEPEVYLHPDLQRRLIRLLDGASAQIIMASHSADVIAEAPVEGVLWVDRKSGGARRPRSQKLLSALSISLGSSYNLALARSMRTRLVIASDCEDLRVIRILARHVGASAIANENAVHVVQLRPAHRWLDSTNIGEGLREVLPAKVPAVLLLQSANRPSASNEEIVRRLTVPGVKVVIWSRAEIENYLLDPELIARVSGASAETLAVQIGEVCERLRDSTRSSYVAQCVAAAPEGTGRQAFGRAEAEFDSLWLDESRRIEVVSGSLVIRELNVWLEHGGYRTLSAHQLAKAVRAASLPAEILHVLLRIEELLC